MLMTKERVNDIRLVGPGEKLMKNKRCNHRALSFLN